MKSYHFGVSKTLIWSIHITIGIYFLWLGYNMLITKFKIHGVLLIIFGSLMSTYHAHLWILHFSHKHIHNEN